MIYLDIETYSELSLTAVGTRKYAQNCELMLLSLCIDDGPVMNFDSNEDPKILTSGWWRALTKGHSLCAHNTAFERTVLRELGLLNLPIDRWHDTMVVGLTLGLPAKLDLLCQALGFGEAEGKMKEGKELINMFCKPNPKNYKIRRYGKAEKPNEWAMFVEYCEQDAALVRTIWNLLPRFNYDKERKYWLLDQKINDRGLPIDIALAHEAIKLTDDELTRYGKELATLTQDKITKVTQVQRIKDYLIENGQEGLNGLGKDEIDSLIKNAATPACRRVLEIRKEAGKSSVAKYQAAINAEVEGRLHGALQFYGAQRTGRWAGRQLQPQNMLRPMFKDTGTAVMAIKQGTVEWYYDNIIEVVSTCVRSVIATREDTRLVVSDLSNIEGRVLAWLAGERWKLKAFREYDKGTGPDLYRLAYARTFGREIESITTGQRQVGKTLELACIAEGQRILTLRGLVPIEQVLISDRVWDGVEFVAHDGLVCRGEKEVLHYDGLSATSDHTVWVENSEEPISFGCAAIGGQRLLRSIPDNLVSETSRKNEKKKLERDTLEASRIRVYDLLNCGPRNRFTAEGCVVHNCGFQGALGAWAKMANDEANGFIEEQARSRPDDPEVDPPLTLEEKMEGEILQIVRGWRDEHPKIRQLWNDVEAASLAAVQDPGTVYPCGKVKFATLGFENYTWLLCKLPSGRSLWYYAPQVNRVKKRKPWDSGAGETEYWKDVLSYLGMKTGAWMRIPTYGGMMCIAEQTPVLTSEGWLAIERVTQAHLVWDGEEWVAHQGLIDKGVQLTIKAHGVCMTSEHKVLTEQGWKSASQSEKFDRLPCRLPDSGGGVEGFWGRANNVAAPAERQLSCRSSARPTRFRQRVYDLANCGPRHRFTVMDESGQPLIVHNCENITQAVARDILAHGMLTAEESYNYSLVLTVHDELLAEMRNGIGSHEELSEILAINPDWCKDLPLSAEGYESTFYRKG